MAAWGMGAAGVALSEVLLVVAAAISDCAVGLLAVAAATVTAPAGAELPALAATGNLPTTRPCVPAFVDATATGIAGASV